MALHWYKNEKDNGDYITTATWDHGNESYAEGGDFYEAGAPAADAGNVSNWGMNNQFRVIADKICDLNSRILPMEGGDHLLHKIVELGPWDMEAESDLNIPLPLNGITYDKIRRVTVSIKQDGDGQISDFISPFDDTFGNISGSIHWYSDKIVLTRWASGYFSSFNFNNAMMNRGYMVIDYVA